MFINVESNRISAMLVGERNLAIHLKTEEAKRFYKHGYMKSVHRIFSETDPKEIWANHKTLTIRDGDFQVDATTEIFNEVFDEGTKRFSFNMGLYYPSHSQKIVVKHAIPVMKDGRETAIEPPDYLMTQEDFTAAIIKGQTIAVPSRL